jgi:hypothetical protein
MDNVLIFGFAVLAIVLITQRWFWLLVFGISGLAAAFSTLASIFHFQILGAIGFFFLAIICWIITVVIAEGYLNNAN